MAALRSLDHVAYVRFASIYRSFRDVDEFARELETIRAEIAAKAPHLSAEGAAIDVKPSTAFGSSTDVGIDNARAKDGDAPPSPVQ